MRLGHLCGELESPMLAQLKTSERKNELVNLASDTIFLISSVTNDL